MRLLEEEKVKYLLIGGYAVGHYGYPRATVDMDIWIAMEPANAEKVVSVLNLFGFYSPDLQPQIFLDKGRIVRMGNPPVRIEILNDLSGVEFTECFKHLNRQELDGVEINIISLKDLLTNKRAAGRNKDLNDVEHLPEA